MKIFGENFQIIDCNAKNNMLSTYKKLKNKTNK